MENLLHIQINIILSILLIILFGHSYINMNRNQITNRLFMWIIGTTCFVLILEAFSVLLNNPDLKQYIIFHKLVNVLGFLAAPCVPFLGCIFCKEWINRYQKNKIKISKLLIIPLIVNGIASLLSYKKNILFYITDDNIYERGSLFFILPCVTYIYVGYILYFIYKYQKKFTNSELIMFGIFYIVPALLTVVQLKIPSYLSIWNGTAIVIVVVYIFILNDQAFRDSLTGLENRLSFEHYAQKIDDKKLNKLFLVYLDIDEFKSINDNYGHHEGDEAIKIFSSLLNESFQLRQKKIMRLGGDEFLIILENQQKEKVSAYIQSLTQYIEAYNSGGEKPYKLSFSYGLVRYIEEFQNINELMKYADELMYEQKQNKKCKV